MSCSVHTFLGAVVAATLLVAGTFPLGAGTVFFPTPAAGCLTLTPLPLPAVEPPLVAAVPLPAAGFAVGGLVVAGFVGVVLLGAGLVGVVLFGGILIAINTHLFKK